MRGLSLLLILMVLISPTSQADKLDVSTNTDVINRLENVISNMDREDDLMQNVWLRLADLYAERARLYAMQEAEQHCKSCKDAKSDRTNALKYYQKVFDKSPLEKEKRESILLQIAHLNDLNGDTVKTIALYTKIIRGGKKHYSASLVGQAHTGLGDIDFRKALVAKAQKHYDDALKIAETPRRQYINYRLAWCHFNQDHLKKAIGYLVTILESKETESGDYAIDPDKKTNSSFQEDVARDLATFYAKGTVGQKEIDTLVSLTPEVAKSENITYLASELERLGKKKAALLAWGKAQSMGAVNEKPVDPQFAKGPLESQINIVQLEFDTDKKSEAMAGLDKALSDWKSNGCAQTENCGELKKKARKLLVDLQKSTKSSKELLNLFGLFVTLFPDDSEITFIAGDIAKDLKDWDFATLYYQQTSNLCSQTIKKKGASSETIENAKNNLEAALLGEIEVAELTKDSQRRLTAYDHYLTLNPNGDKNVDVRYQKAQVHYDGGNHEEAANQFRAVALLHDEPARATRYKAANLALDSLVLAKKVDLIEPWAKEFAAHFPDRRSDFESIARKAALNKAVEIVADNGASGGDLQASLNRLKGINMDVTPAKDRITVLRNRLVIAEKLKNLPEVNDAATRLMATPGISSEDRELAISRKVWVAEQNRDFKTAFVLTKKMKMPGLTREDKVLKLILSAELAGENPTTYYKEYISLRAPHSEQYEGNSQNIMVKMVRQSRDPVGQLQAFQKRLRQNSNVYSQLCFEVFAKTQNYRFAEITLKDSQVRNSPSGRSIAKFLFLKKFKGAQAHFIGPKLNSKSNRSLKSTLNARLLLIKRVESWAKKGSESQDWTLQVVTLTALSEQNRKLAEDIILLPTPKHLNKVQTAEYKRLVKAQALPYWQTHRQILAKVQELWNKTDMIHDLQKQMGASQKPVQNLLAEEVNMLVRIRSGAKL